MKMILIVVLVLCASFASALNVETNVTLNISDGVGLLWFPQSYFAFNASSNVSQYIAWNISVNVSERVNSSVSLSSNQALNLTGNYETLSLFCAPNSTTCTNYTTIAVNDSCSQTAHLYAGEKFYMNNSICNLAFSCDKTALSCSNTTFTVNRSVYVGKNGDTLLFSMGNDTKSFSMGVINASFELPFEILCPTSIKDIEEEATARETFDVCATYFPMYANFFNLTLNKCFNNFDDYKAYVAAHETVVANTNQALSDCRAAGGVKDGTITSMSAEIVAYKEQLIQRDSDADNMMIVVSVLSFLFILSLVGIALLWAHIQKEV